MKTMDIGARIKTIQESKGYSQEAVAKAADNMGLTQYARIERGDANPVWPSLEKIIKGLDCTIEEFFSSEVKITHLDDDPEMRDRERRLLEKCYEVLCCEDTETALALENNINSFHRLVAAAGKINRKKTAA